MDRQLAALIARGIEGSARRHELIEQVEPEQVEVVEDAVEVPSRLIAPQRASCETNLCRRGFWLAVGGGAQQLTLPLDTEDRLGVITVQPGPSGPLTTTELEVITWVCSRWREQGIETARRVPFSLRQLAADFGWASGGQDLRRLAQALDRLRDNAITAEVWGAREREARARRRFGLLADWQVGDPDRPGKLRRYGWIELGSWLLEQLRSEHLTYLDWTTLRRLERAHSKRLYTFLEAERMEAGREKRWPVDTGLFAALGIGAGNPRQARVRLAAAAKELEQVSSHYTRVDVQPRARGRGYHLIAIRRRPRAK